jgi:hypothetical protein
MAPPSPDIIPPPAAGDAVGAWAALCGAGLGAWAVDLAGPLEKNPPLGFEPPELPLELDLDPPLGILFLVKIKINYKTNQSPSDIK